MSNIKGQTKWLVKHFSSIILLLLVVCGGVAYFTDAFSVKNFGVVALVTLVIVMVLGYYNLINIRSVILFALIAVILVFGVTFSKSPTIKSGQFQAVFLENGQSFFGHLSNINTPNATLTDVYYLQSKNGSTNSTADTKNSTSADSQLGLFKLGKEIHAPEDRMNIKTDKILYWENLSDSGKVVQAIHKSEQQN